MSALTDLQTAISKLSTDLTAYIAANAQGATQAELVSLKASVDALDAQIAAAQPPA